MTTMNDVELVVIDDDEPASVVSADDNVGMTDDEIAGFFADGLVAAGYGEDVSSLGMVALLPTREDAQRLAVEDGLPPNDLHVTLFFLGKVNEYTVDVRESIKNEVQSVANAYGVINAKAFSINVFNPGKNAEHDTCIVLGVGDETLEMIQREISSRMHSVAMNYDRRDLLPEQKKPWIPHITLTYTDNLALVKKFTDRMGPVEFDRLCVDFGGTRTEIPLYRNLVAGGDTMSDDIIDIQLLDRYIKVASITTDEAFGSDRNLRAYWTRGEGALKIRWGTDGSFARCVSHLGKYVRNPQGLCAEYHKSATGQWPTEGGKHGIPSSVDIAVTADAAEAASNTDVETTVDESGNWEGILVMEGVETGDGRKFSSGSLSWPDTAAVTVPLMWAKSNMGEHKGSVIAGRINEIWRDPANPAMIRGRGKFDLGGAEGREAFRMVRDKMLNGISIDPDQISDADVELQFAPIFTDEGEEPDPETMASRKLAQATGMEKPTLTVFHAGRIRGATLVAFPAFVEAQIQLSHSDAVTADGHSEQKVSFAQWDGPANDLRVARELDYSDASKAFAYVHPRGKKVKKYDCAYLHHELTDDGDVGPPNMDAVQAAMDLVNQGYPQTLSLEARRHAYEHLAGHMRYADIETPAFSFDAIADELVACGGDKAPPKEWFDDPKLDGPTPLTIDDDGHVFGHAALWSSCHTSFGDTCVQPPYEEDYSYFTTGEVVCADGSRVAAGQITLGTSHAPTRGISTTMAVDHYGNTGTSVADVAAGSDSFGIWVNGAARPGANADRIRELRAASLSGDWRRIGGALRLVAMLAVNVPGFPVPRTTTFTSKGRQLSLVAAGIPQGEMMNQARMNAQVAALRARINPSPEAMATAVEMLRARIDAPLGIFREKDHPRGPLGKFIDSVSDVIDAGTEKVTGIKMPKRYGPNGERNTPSFPGEKPTPEHVMRRQEKETMKRMKARD